MKCGGDAACAGVCLLTADEEGALSRAGGFSCSDGRVVVSGRVAVMIVVEGFRFLEERFRVEECFRVLVRSILLHPETLLRKHGNPSSRAQPHPAGAAPGRTDGVQ